MNTGVPFSAYQPRTFLDPGPDARTGTSDDRVLPVYEQDPAAFGQDHFVLTNPSGLRMDQRGVVIGSLYADPNTMLFASGSPAMDRSFAGKVWMYFPLPGRFGKLEIMNTAVFLGGYPYARRLLVTGLAQGPFVVDATPRGTSQGVTPGYRTDSVYDWNLKVSRSFEVRGLLHRGTLRASVEVFNLLNLGASLRVSDLTGPQFMRQIPLEMQPPRFARASVSWEF
ncbi:MAG TPA: hypothetical protein VLN48_09205 [Bryobacteraceae bacterium]|nr:hypothetical protein [Bryobacteraceae bacterium]